MGVVQTYLSIADVLVLLFCHLFSKARVLILIRFAVVIASNNHTDLITANRERERRRGLSGLKNLMLAVF